MKEIIDESIDRPTDGCCVCVCPPFLDSIRQDTRPQKEEEEKEDARLSSSFQCVQTHYYITFLFCVCVCVCAV
jgi:hypothetical protein